MGTALQTAVTLFGSFVMAAGASWGMIEVRARELHPQAVSQKEIALLREVADRDHAAIKDLVRYESARLREELQEIRDILEERHR